MRSLEGQQRGFTLIELLISTTIMSVVLLGASAVAVQVGRLYYKGVVASRTQSAARNLVDNISRPIQLEGASVTKTSSGTYTLICVGNQRYTIAKGLPQQSSGSGVIRQAVWRDEISNSAACNLGVPSLVDPVPGGVKGTGLLQDNMRVSDIDVQENGGLWSINVTVAYGDDDNAFEAGTTPQFTQCKSDYSSSQFCAVAAYDTKVSRRITGD